MVNINVTKLNNEEACVTTSIEGTTAEIKAELSMLINRAVTEFSKISEMNYEVCMDLISSKLKCNHKHGIL